MKHNLLFPLVMLCLAIMGRQAYGQYYPLYYTHTEKVCGESSCSFKLIESYGSCVCIGRVNPGFPKWFYLTAAHNITNNVKPNVWDGVAWVPANVLEIDRTMDVALLGIETLQSPRSVRLASRHLMPNEACRFAAYTHCKVPVIRDARVKIAVDQPMEKSGDTKFNETYLFSVDAIPVVSNSGGGIIKDGELFGIISAGDKDTICVDGLSVYLWLIERKRFPPIVPVSQASLPPSPSAEIAKPPASTSQGDVEEDAIEAVEPEVIPNKPNSAEIGTVNATPVKPPIVPVEQPEKQAAQKSGVNWWTIGKWAGAIGLAAATGGGSVYLTMARAAAPIAVGAAKHVVTGVVNRVNSDEVADDQSVTEGGQSANIDRIPFPRQLDEARQLRELRKREGRIPEFDALVGMVLDDEANLRFEKGTASENEVIKNFISSVKSRANSIAPPSVEPYLASKT